jgi:hypothetical protein
VTNTTSQPSKESAHDAYDRFLLNLFPIVAADTIAFASLGVSGGACISVIYWLLWASIFAATLRVGYSAYAIHKYLFAMETADVSGTQSSRSNERKWRDARRIQPSWVLAIGICTMLLVLVRIVGASIGGN